MRSSAVFRASSAASASPSSGPTPTSTVNPGPIAPTVSPSTVTALSRTRWISTRIAALSFPNRTCPFVGPCHQGNRVCRHALTRAGKAHALARFALYIDLAGREIEQ